MQTDLSQFDLSQLLGSFVEISNLQWMEVNGAILFLILNSVFYGVNSNKLPFNLPYHHRILNFYFFQFKKFPPNTLTPIIHSEILTIATPNYLIGSLTISSVALLLTASVDLLLML